MVTPGGFIARKESDAKTIDSLITKFGACGPFQIRLVCATYSAQLCSVWSILFMVFGNYHTDWRCSNLTSSILNDSFLDNSTTANWTVSEFFTQWTTVSEYFTDWTTASENFTNWTSRLTANQSSENETNVDACDAIKTCERLEFAPGFSSIVTEWGLVCDKAWSQSFIIAVQMAGVLVGSYFGGIIGERCGRRVNLYINVGLHTAFNVIAAFSVDYQMFTCLRFFIGIFAGGILSCCLLYPVEFVGGWWRGLLNALPVWNIGAVSFSLVVLLLKNWRHLHIATALFSFLVFLLGFWVPESLRWLVVHGKVDKAKDIANMVAAMNSRPPPNTSALEIFAKEERKRLRAKSAQFQHVPDLFKSDKYFSISVKMGFVWLCMSLVYYTVTFGMKFLTGDFFINFIIFSVAEIPGVLFVIPASRKLGPRLGSLLFFVLIATACFGVVVVTLVVSEDNKSTIIFVLALLAKVNLLAVWMLMTMFSNIMFPSQVRGLSTDLLNYCARVGGMVAPFLLPTMVGSLYAMFLVLGICLIFCCVMLISIPLTKEVPHTDGGPQSKSHLSIIVEETEMEVENSECEES